MPDTILFKPIGLDQRQTDQVVSAMGHEGYQLLREVIAAHAIRLHVEAINTGVYASTNEGAKEAMAANAEHAARYVRALDVLDEMEKNPSKWFKAELKAGR